MWCERMKIGITRTKNPRKNDEGKPFEYTVWFRTSDGTLQSVAVTKDISLYGIVDHVGEEEGKVQLSETSKETRRETFLQQI